MAGKTPEKQHRATLLQYAGLWSYKSFCFVLRLMDIRLVALIGRCVGYLVWAVSSRRRAIVARNFRIIVDPTLRKDKLSSMVRRNMVRTSMNLACSLRTGLMSKKEMERSIRMEGADHFEACGQNGHCVISCIPHAGNWEILARIRPYFTKVEHFGSMYRRMSNPLLEDLVYKSRTAYGCEMFSKEDGLRNVLKLARTGGLLGVLSDQFTQEGLFLPYFGKVTGVTPLPALLYKRCKGKGHLFSVFTRNTKLGCWDAVLGREIQLPEKCDTMAELTMQVNLALEKCQNEDIIDGFWMHHRWKCTNKFAPVQDDEVNEVARANTRLPFRIIATTPAAFEEAILTIPALRVLSDCRFDAQLTVVCPAEQKNFWKKEPYITHVVTSDEKCSAFEQLDSDEIYKDGPFDVLFMFSEDKSLFRNLLQLSPIYVSALGDNALRKKCGKQIRSRHKKAEMLQSRHRSQHYLHLLEYTHELSTQKGVIATDGNGNPEASGTFIAPFSTLGDADCWPEAKWKELTEKLPAKPTLLALTRDKTEAEAMAARLGINCCCVAPEDVCTVLGPHTELYAVDGLLPQLAAHSNCRSTVLMSSRPVELYGPMGEHDKAVYHHAPCHPCYRNSCDQGKEHCTDAITVDDVLNATAPKFRTTSTQDSSQESAAES
ncbi:MAG: hypothetical protein IJ498_04000 [Akkermansia sp.]|nr:hypothetical protein [Akkermansia sp.]